MDELLVLFSHEYVSMFTLVYLDIFLVSVYALYGANVWIVVLIQFAFPHSPFFLTHRLRPTHSSTPTFLVSLYSHPSSSCHPVTLMPHPSFHARQVSFCSRGHHHPRPPLLFIYYCSTWVHQVSHSYPVDCSITKSTASIYLLICDCQRDDDAHVVIVNGRWSLSLFPALFYWHWKGRCIDDSFRQQFKWQLQ